MTAAHRNARVKGCDFRSCRAAVIFRACGADSSGRCRQTLRQAREQGVKRGPWPFSDLAPSLMEHLMRMTVCGKSARNVIRFLAAIAVLGALNIAPVAAQQGLPPGTLPPGESRFSSDDLVNTGHRFFGTVSRGLAQIVEKAVSQWGLPNGYILGEEAAGAFVAGLRYGEGILYTKNAGDLKVYLEGPSVRRPP